MTLFSQKPSIRERYRVPGGGAILVPLAAGDLLWISDPEGGQIAEIATFQPSGTLCTDIFNISFDAPFTLNSEDHTDLYAGLLERRIDPKTLKVSRIFSGSESAGVKVDFAASSDGLCLIAAPGLPMAIDSQTPPTEIDVVIQRKNSITERDLPPPLGRIRTEVRINRASALAYEVREGEFIQVIDVAGKQCSDFLAFQSKALQRGMERGIDVAATRTVMGRAYPQPGLHAKYLDADMRALVEVVRDTVGRHDTFGFACTSKYYEDMGYPGHANCSDNFNAALSDYGITPRRGWAAANLFYNTAFDRNQVLFFDEPWSRPGDYVLFRALSDLVCASSACPDDIDAANGWNPTDIHVRIYEPTAKISKGVAYRMTPDSVPQLTRESAFHSKTSALTRNFVDYKNFWLPTCFNSLGPIEEYIACRERAVVIDLSALRKFEITGPDAEALLQATMTRNIRRLAVGQVVYTAMCYETGGMLDDGTLLKLGPNNFRWVCGNDFTGVWLRDYAHQKNFNVLVKTSTDQITNLALQGPRSRDILKEILWTPPTQPSATELKWFRFTIGRLGGPDGLSVMVSRTGYTGELGYELWCHPKAAPSLWETVMAAGDKHGLVPLGLDALDILRIESGLIFAGYEFDDQTTPFEAGIGFTVALDSTNPDDFVGKAALQRDQASPRRTLVGLEIEGNEAAAHGDCVHVGRAQVGVITSATRSPLLRKNIALCRLAVEYAAIGTSVEVGKLDGHQKRLRATVVRFPFYDPEKTRPRS